MIILKCPQLIFTFLLLATFNETRGDAFRRFHEDSESRSIIPIPPRNAPPPPPDTPSPVPDTISLENYLRNYRHGPLNDRYILTNHDTIAAYVGPFPKGHPDETDLPAKANGMIRAWAMFDSTTYQHCDLDAVHEWGQLAIFKCPLPGVYRAYAVESELQEVPLPVTFDFIHKQRILGWFNRNEKEHFNLLTEKNLMPLPQSVRVDRVDVRDKKMEALRHWALGMDYNFTWTDPNGLPQSISWPIPNNKNGESAGVVISDPIRVIKSYYCYYWMYTLREVAREGYEGSEIIPHVEDADGKHQSVNSYIMLELLIWIAEPSGVGFKETLSVSEEVQVSEYSKVITKRFFEIGLSPCLRKAHDSIEVIDDVRFVAKTHAAASSQLWNTPHWRAVIKIHTDRLISTLASMTFTIASRQNTASFSCFVGDTRVYFRMRDFQFVPDQKLQPKHVNLNVSWLLDEEKRHSEFEDNDYFYGHGVHHVGYKASKVYQPASQRSDVVVIPNPCNVQEFAFSVGGSLYIVENFLRKGAEQTKKVTLPTFSEIKDTESKDYLWIMDVAFTPTHVAFVMTEGYVVLHPSSASRKGIAQITMMQKYRPDSFVKRRWCPRTASLKLSAMMLPVFDSEGGIHIIQVYPTEGNVPTLVVPSSSSCLPEGTGFVKKLEDQTHVINETDIHYQEFAAVVRTNQKTGLVDPPVPSRPPPPPPPERDIYEQTAFILDSSRNFVGDGEDPHFPHDLIDPASRVLENDLQHFNRFNFYSVKEKGEMETFLSRNGLTLLPSSHSSITRVEFTAEEKHFLFALTFNSEEIKTGFDQEPYQLLISTIIVTNYPYLVKTPDMPIHAKEQTESELLDTVMGFPGTILIRISHYSVDVVKSRDRIENIEHSKTLQGRTQVPFVPEVYTLGTAIPSYIINLGDVLVYSSIESRYARPLHYYSWDTLQNSIDRNLDGKPLFFNDSSLIFKENGTLYDIVVTEQGMISVLRRKKKRHLVQDDEVCAATPDTEAQKVILGSVVTVDGLREMKPFFKNDNIFQLGTPDGEIVYGVYDVKPRSSFHSCDKSYSETKDDPEPCVEQPTDKSAIPVCTKEHDVLDVPCRDPGYLKYCQDPSSGLPQNPSEACLRINKGCPDSNSRFDERDAYTPPEIKDASKCGNVNVSDDKVIPCLPKRAPREDIRSVNILGTTYHSYLQGSLESIRSLHPEANTAEWQMEVKEELDLCPFVEFKVYHKDIDFAEVGYQVRVTAQASYIGTDLPTEADILVEYERTMGVVVEISTSVEEIRQLTRIVKAVDIHFHIPDYKLEQLMSGSRAEKHKQRTMRHSFEDIRAREKFSVFSITFRPSVLNTRCKSTEFFKTVQFNVGCNPFSTIRLMSEATTLKRINWTEALDEQSGFKWHRDYKTWNLTIPKVHIFYKQLKKEVFKCDKNPSFCEIPYFHLFKNDIFTLSYRDYFVPKFEQFLTASSRPVSANVVLYDMLGSREFNWTLNKYKAGCNNLAILWYDKLLQGTKEINKETFEHENVYLYFRDCFDMKENQGQKEMRQYMLREPFYLFNLTNQNSLKFQRSRNHIFIFRAVVMNTYYNRFTYCRQLDTFFMVRITGIPIPRQGLALWQYLLTMLLVSAVFIVWYYIFAKFYTWTVPTRRTIQPNRDN